MPRLIGPITSVRYFHKSTWITKDSRYYIEKKIDDITNAAVIFYMVCCCCLVYLLGGSALEKAIIYGVFSCGMCYLFMKGYDDLRKTPRAQLCQVMDEMYTNPYA